MNIRIRPIEKKDNPDVKRLVVDVLKEFGRSGPGFACADPELEDMHATYSKPRMLYYVAEDTATGDVLGGAGVAQLAGTREEDGICEMQKLYLFKNARGKGVARMLVERLIADAKRFGFTSMYIETLPDMTDAQGLYARYGFVPLQERLGNTGHSGCNVFMLLDLTRAQR